VTDARFYRGCAGKKQYPSRKVALAAKRQIGDPGLEAYRCTYCKRFHLGHSKWKKESQ
jgi:hypothetical protein